MNDIAEDLAKIQALLEKEFSEKDYKVISSDNSISLVQDRTLLLKVTPNDGLSKSVYGFIATSINKRINDALEGVSFKDTKTHIRGEVR